jgi:hypothetical protein
MSIRKFVGWAAALGAAVTLGLSVHTAGAHVMGSPSAADANSVTLSSQCLAALQDLRSAIISDRQRDAEEGAAADPAEDSAENASIQSLIASLRTACADQIAAFKPSGTIPKPAAPAVTAQCKTAAQAWQAYAKSLWTAGKAPTQAQLAQLRQLGQAVRSACGWEAGEWPPRG